MCWTFANSVIAPSNGHGRDTGRIFRFLDHAPEGGTGAQRLTPSQRMVSIKTSHV